jgi:hypothetical protein
MAQELSRRFENVTSFKGERQLKHSLVGSFSVLGFRAFRPFLYIPFPPPGHHTSFDSRTLTQTRLEQKRESLIVLTEVDLNAVLDPRGVARSWGRGRSTSSLGNARKYQEQTREAAW